jgi:hypothetical protein
VKNLNNDENTPHKPVTSTMHWMRLFIAAGITALALLTLQTPGCAPDSDKNDIGGLTETEMADGNLTPVTLRFLDNGEPTPVRAYFKYRKRPYVLGPEVGYHFPIYWDRFYQDKFYPVHPEIPILDMEFGQDHHYYFLTGEATVGLVPGPYEVTVYKGLEYRPITMLVDVADTAMVRELNLKRWVAPTTRDWYSGDVHIHLARDGKEDDIYLAMQEADGLNVGNYLQLQRLWQGAVQKTWGKSGEAQRGNSLLRSGEEPRSPFGHKLLLGIDKLVLPVGMGDIAVDNTLISKLSMDIFAEGHAAGGITGYAHGNGMGRHPASAVDVALGDVDFLEIFQFNNMNTDFWYDVLSAGFRIAPAAGTDFPVNLGKWSPWPQLISPLSSERMYVKADSVLNYEGWMGGVKSGQVTLTNGPMVDFVINNKRPGDEVQVPDSEDLVSISVTVDHWRPMKEVRLIANGKVLQTFTNPQQQTRWKILAKGPATESMWMAVHVLSDSTGNFTDEEILLQAHTAPIYIIRDGKPIADKDALNRLIDNVRGVKKYFSENTNLRYAEPMMKGMLLQRCDEAIEEYQKRLDAAQ